MKLRCLAPGAATAAASGATTTIPTAATATAIVGTGGHTERREELSEEH